jgi:hypothetical protein
MSVSAVRAQESWSTRIEAPQARYVPGSRSGCSWPAPAGCRGASAGTRGRPGHMTVITGTRLGIQHQRLLLDEGQEIGTLTGQRVSWMAPPTNTSDRPRRGSKRGLKDGVVVARLHELSNLLEESTLRCGAVVVCHGWCPRNGAPGGLSPSLAAHRRAPPPPGDGMPLCWRGTAARHRRSERGRLARQGKALTDMGPQSMEHCQDGGMTMQEKSKNHAIGFDEQSC